MKTIIRRKLINIAFASIITLGCAGVATSAAIVDTVTNSSVAYADQWRHNNGGWWLQTNNGYATGWKQINGTWYYFDQNGWMKTGWQWIGGKWYYLNNSGAMAIGWKNVGGVWYYLNNSGAMVTGWNKVGSKWYYHNNSGAMQISWQKINGKWYHLSGSGAMDINRWIGNYYVQNDGSMATSRWIGQYYVGVDGLWDRATTSANPLHISTDYYEFDLPTNWKNKVSYTTSENETLVYLTGRKDCSLFDIFVIPTTDTLYPRGDATSLTLQIGTTPSGAAVYISRINWPYIACQDAMGYYNSDKDRSDKYSNLIELQSNGACTLDQLLEDPEAGQYYLLDNDYIFNEIAPSIKFRN